MALDKVVDSAVLDAGMISVADAIRAKAGTTEPLAWPDGFKAAIEAISGGGSTGLAYDMGEFVFDADIASHKAPAVQHNLGEIPDCIIVWTDNWAGNTEVIDTTYGAMVGFLWMREFTGMTERGSTSVSAVNPIILFMNIAKNDYRLSIAVPTSAGYCVNLNTLTATEFYPPNYGPSNYWRGGVTYKYFVSKAWWNIGGVAGAE